MKPNKKIENEIIKYIEKIYLKKRNWKIKITKTDILKNKEWKNKFLIYFEYDFLDDNANNNHNDNNDWGSLYLDLAKIKNKKNE